MPTPDGWPERLGGMSEVSRKCESSKYILQLKIKHHKVLNKELNKTKYFRLRRYDEV